MKKEVDFSEDKLGDYLSFPYPEELFDEDGYPTEDAIDYINNWSMIADENDNAVRFGQFFPNQNYTNLIEYIRQLWVYPTEGVVYEGGLLELHTIGWSGNEDIIRELKKTGLWMFKLRATRIGGHYFFRVDSESEYDYDVIKVESRY